MPIKKDPKPKSLLKTLFKWLAFLLAAFASTFLLACYFFVVELDKELPDIGQLQHVQYQMPFSVYSKDNLLMAQFGEKRRIPLTIAQVPPTLLKAFIAAEDDSFYQHNGVDFKGLARAAAQLALTGKKRQGGSTITMQVARNFLLSNERTYLRKIKEILLALKIESQYSKDQILELYLNKIYMGQRAYGIAAAAQTYYGKELSELALHQQAMIAGLPKAPSIYNPISNPQRALLRRDYVLRRMLDLHYINQNDYQIAINTPDNAELKQLEVQLQAPYIAEMVRQEIMSKYGESAYTLGLKVYTTIPSHYQIAADRALQQTLHEYDERHGYRGYPHKNINKNNGQLTENVIGDTQQAQVLSVSEAGVIAKLHDSSEIEIPWKNLEWARPFRDKNAARNTIKAGDLIWVRKRDEFEWGLTQIPEAEAAFVALDPNSGAILALSGGFDFYHSKYNRATQSKRQPGSGFKPIIYTAALEKGFTAASIINDAPIVIEDPSQEDDWRPENYSRRFLGPTSLRVALRESINLVSIRLLQETGISHAINTALRFGFDREQLPGTLSLALGSGYASPLRMASAYAVFANGGFLVKPFFIEHIEDHQGNVIFKTDPVTVCNDCPEQEQNQAQASHAPRAISAKIHFLMNSLLRDVVQRGTATQAKQLGRNDVAGKTGTTNEQRDAWFNGYASGIVASSWIGFDNSSPLGAGETGGKAALPMWIKFMKSVQDEFPEKPLAQPEGIVQAYINPEDGLLLDPDDKGGIWEYFSEETVPKTMSSPQMEEMLDEDVVSEESLF